MAMSILIVRTNEVRLVADPRGGWIDIPDLKLPRDAQFAPTDRPRAKFLRIGRGDRSVEGLFLGPYQIGAAKFYLVQIEEDDQKRTIKFLRGRMGAPSVEPYIAALRARPALRAWAKAQGHKPATDSKGRVVGVRLPLCVAGKPNFDLDGDDPESAEEIIL